MIIPSLKKWLQRRNFQGLNTQSSKASTGEKSRVICILGMHRSGTSYLTGSLQQAGLELHRVHEANPHNKKGNRENPQIMQLNDWVLDSNQGSWHQPPEQIVWSEAQLQQGRDIVAQYADFSCWGFKDPRVLITLEGWQQLLPQLEFVGIFRHPALVARSINARNENLSFEAGLSLWVDYNTRLLSLLKQAPFPLLHFAPAEIDMLHSVRNLAQSLDLPQPERIDFYDAALVNQDDLGQLALSPEVDELYTALKELAQ